MNIKVNIDRLILTGFGKEDTAGFVREFEQELSRLVMENGVNGISSMSILNARTVHITRGAKPLQASWRCSSFNIPKHVFRCTCSTRRESHVPQRKS